MKPKQSTLLLTAAAVASILVIGCGSHSDSPATLEQQKVMAAGSPPPPGAVEKALKAMQHQGPSDQEKQAAIAQDAQAHAAQASAVGNHH